MRHGTRKIQVKKADLIAKIKANKENHVKEFDKAVIAYREEAQKQLQGEISRLVEGALDIKLDLITPVDNSDNYDKILEMFTWDVRDEVELQQDEFQEYVQDTTDFAVTARMSNSAYLMQ